MSVPKYTGPTLYLSKNQIAKMKKMPGIDVERFESLLDQGVIKAYEEQK